MRTLKQQHTILLGLLALSLTAGDRPQRPRGPRHPPPPPYSVASIIQGPFFQSGFIDQMYVAIDPVTHNILVTNSEANEVGIFTSAGASLNVYPPMGQSLANSNANGYFNWPAGIAVDPASRNMVIADSGNNRVEIFVPSGTTWVYASKFGSAGSGPGQFNTPYGVAIDPVSHNIVVADSRNNRIQIFSAVGAFVSQFGGSGSGTGQFKSPQGVAVDPGSRNIIVADGGNARVQIFDLNANHLSTFGSKGTGHGQFSPLSPPDGDPANFTSPMGVAVDPTSDNIVVTDGGNSRVEIFTSTGQFQSTFGSHGTAPGQFQTPLGVAVDAVSCNAVVDDYGNFRVQIFAPLQQVRPASAVTNPPTVVNYDQADYVLHGTVSTGNCGQSAGNSTATVSFGYYFAHYAPNPPSSYPNTVAATPNTIAAGLLNQAVSAPLHVNPCDLTYHYRIVVTNSAGTSYGNDQVINKPSCY